MLRRLVRWRLDGYWWLIGESRECVQHILDTSMKAFLTFQRVLPVAGYRRAMPKDVADVATILAVQDADCGSCVQIAVNIARHNGMSAEHVRAVLAGREDELPPDLAIAHSLVRAVLQQADDQEGRRGAFRDRFGEEALVELAMVIGAARVFPITKRVLGFATSCALVDIQT